ncbi:DegT/DnrJ/EryC1/StrS family aminotransferase [bacterium]|nr:DegT/DnrJ/EryC1/StrS family aminotransferase [bacterium]
MIPVFKPSFNDEELEALKEPFKSGWIGLGPKTTEFEKKFANYIGVKYAVATNSCTASLHLALRLMEIENYEVITTPMTFVSTNHAILYNNGIPVFTDIYSDTLNINVDEIKKNITNKTKAIITVHYGGHSCEMDLILEMAKKYDLKVIEDVAHGCGGEYKEKKLGSIGDIGCFSFHAVKNLATGDGGMITTNDAEICEKLRKLRWLGVSRDTWDREEKDEKYSWYYSIEDIGYKYHMNDIQAAIGLVQLKKLDSMNNRRREISEAYTNAFKSVSWIEVPTIKKYAKCAYHNYVIKTDYRNELNIYLQEKGISTGVHYIPNNHYSMYRKFGQFTPVSDKVWKKLLTLPLYPDLSDSDVNMIIDTIKKFKKK